MIIPSSGPSGGLSRRYVLGLAYRSSGIDADQWFQLFTLCIAPLVLHLAVGVPEPTVLRGDGPGWWDRLPLFNPISIMWRYLAIADRRFRARDWDKYDMAASNAAFWDGDGAGWHGSEDLLLRSRRWVTREPASSHVNVLSASALSTLGLTAQGVQAAASLKQASAGALNTAFNFLALLSLVRLLAACWLSSDYGFGQPRDDDDQQLADEAVPHHPQWQLSTLSQQLPQQTRPSLVSSAGRESKLCPRLYDTASVPGIMFRVSWTALLVVFFLETSFAEGWHVVWAPGAPITTSMMLSRVVCFIIASGNMATQGFYVLLGRNTTTILPCLQCTWYKLYTCCLFVLAIAVVVVSSIETHACLGTAMSLYTTFPCEIAISY